MKEQTTLDYIYAEIAHVEDAKEASILLDTADSFKRDLEVLEKTRDQMGLAMINKELSRFYSMVVSVTNIDRSL